MSVAKVASPLPPVATEVFCSSDGSDFTVATGNADVIIARHCCAPQ
jgi:hypothetical protein